MRRLIYPSLAVLALLGALASPVLAAPPKNVTGLVTPVKWAQEIEVCTYTAELNERCVVPRVNGTYTYPAFPEESTLVFVPTYRSRLLTQYYDHASSLKDASFKVPEKEANADLLEGGALTGTVTAEVGGAPLAEVEVCASATPSPTSKSCEETNASGEYELHSLPSGHYKVGFWGKGRSAVYAPSYYQGKPSLPEATPIAVTQGETTTGIDASLAEGAQIGGIVRASGATALEGIPVCLFVLDGSSAESCTESASGGAYSFQGLPTGSYQVGFSLGSGEIGGSGTSAEVDGFQPQYYHGVSTRDAAQTISVIAPEKVGGIDASLSPPPPAPPAPPPPVITAPIVAAAPPVAIPPVKTGCKKGYRKRKVKGKVRCVRVAKHSKTKKHVKHKPKKAAHAHSSSAPSQSLGKTAYEGGT